MDGSVGGRGSSSASRSTRATIFWIVGAALLAYAVVLAVTGGLDFTVIGVRIRSRSWQRPALLGLACTIVAAITDSRRVAEFTRATRDRIRRSEFVAAGFLSPRGVALIAVAWTVIAGVVFGTDVAGGADSSGYLNQVQLFGRQRILDDFRLSGDAGWPDRAFKLAPLGFRPSPDGQHLSPIYPPGYPLLMTPVYQVHERAVYLIVPLCGAFSVWLTFALARRLGDPVAGAAAALLVAVSPTFLYQLIQPMSDIPATTGWLLALSLAIRGTATSAAIAGLTTGVAILIRPNLAPLAVLVWAACVVASRSPRPWRRALIAFLATIPAVVALGALQSIRYGSAFRSGYGSVGDMFSVMNVGPNLDRYPRWLIETHTPLIALFLIAPLWIWRRRESRALLVILWMFCVGVVTAYLPYMYFQRWEWTYTRFLLPALPIMWLLALTPVVHVRLGARSLNRVVLAGAFLLLLVFSIRTAKVRYVFELKASERKYAYAADFVQRQLPSNSVIVSLQHSGSIWFYTRSPILRWDYVEADSLDSIIGWLKEHHYAPYIVVDEEEFIRLEDRFRGSRQQSLARAIPLTRFGDVVIYALR